jgi:hypothetical protein
MSHKKIRPVNPGVGQKINGDQIQDGEHSSILDEWRRWTSKGTFLQSLAMSHQKIGPANPGVGQKINGNQIEDGGRSGHLGWAAELIIERNLPLVTLNKPQKNRINRPRHLSYNWRKPNVYGNPTHRPNPPPPRHFMIGGIKTSIRSRLHSSLCQKLLWRALGSAQKGFYEMNFFDFLTWQKPNIHDIPWDSSDDYMPTQHVWELLSQTHKNPLTWCTCRRAQWSLPLACDRT